ncbi:hypothetical protein NDU88_003973 [Pleurodeles waltl]|uniref:Uncharacterized protein n=1 Tax=Pleurodeles waltl TaxID=8319 RepID=A0AAV7LTE2_PLEWA|nr:hypothetical protein NDU88_003973 [Pleurodeles waltl]
MSVGAVRGEPVAETTRCARGRAAVPGGRVQSCGRSPGGILAGAEGEAEGVPPLLPSSPSPAWGIKVGPQPWRTGQDPPFREYYERGAIAGCLELWPPPAPPDRHEQRTGLAVAQGEVRPAALRGHT